jgi:hypothetical protein
MLDRKLDNQIRKKPRLTVCVRVKRNRNTGDNHQTSGVRHKNNTRVPITSQR